MITVVFLLLSVVASEATKTNAASSEGGRGWSVARATAIFTSKTLARFRALAQNQARGEDGNSMSLHAMSSILPVLVCGLCLPSLLIPPTDSLGRGPRLPPRRHAMHPNRSCGDAVHCALLPFGDMMLHGMQTILLKRLLKGGKDPATAWASAGHHIRHSSSCPMMEALQCSLHGTSQSPRFTTKKWHSLHHSLVKHAKDTGVSALPVEKLGQLVPFAAGPPEVSAQGPPNQSQCKFPASLGAGKSPHFL